MSTYYPYFRGKQFELITIRETAQLLAEKGFVPIIEPVRESLSGLQRALQAVNSAGGKAIVIVNPYHGALRQDGANISNLLNDEFIGNGAISAGILLKSGMDISEVLACYQAHAAHQPALVHAGFTEPRELLAALEAPMPNITNVFVEEQDKLVYRRHFQQSKRILIKDGFRRQRNADYPEIEEFSDLHLTYKERGVDGFGDFLIVGDVYTEGGGPAYAVAIHLTFIDDDNDNVMYIHHFVSTSRDTPTDPAGKFRQALDKLVNELDGGNSKLLETGAIQEFRRLHQNGHFPGLGYIKKLSMQHHIETLANQFS